MGTTSLNQMIHAGVLWQGQQASVDNFVSTGFQQLDQQLGGGWQLGNLVELLCQQPGCGELRLLLPLLLERQTPEKWLLWVDPPWLPYAPALRASGLNLDHILVVHTRQLKETGWVLEQALKSGCCSAVLGWLPSGQEKMVRRLQVAASETGTLGFLLRPWAAREQSSAAPYRLQLEPASQGISLTLLKRKGGWAQPEINLAVGEDQLLPALQAVPTLHAVG